MRRTPDVTRIDKPRSEARLVLDSMGQVLEASDAAHRLLGYRPGKLQGLFLAWITPPSRHALLTQLARAFESARPLCLPTVVTRDDDGSLLPVVLTTQPAESQRGKTLVVTLEHDEEPTSARPPATSQTFPVQRAPRAQSKAKRAPDLSRSSAVLPTRTSAIPPPPPYPSRPIRLHLPDAPPPRRGRASDASPAPTPSKASAEQTPHGDVSECLTACMELLHWLDMQLERHDTPGLVRERALTRMVVQEASALLHQCRAGLKAGRRRAR